LETLRGEQRTVRKPDKDAIRQAAEDDLFRFIALVAPHRVLGQCHKDLIKWWTREDAKDCQMALLPRDHQKSAMMAFRCAWEITKNPAITILYISSTSGLAEKQLKMVKDILESPIYQRYWPDMIHPDRGKREKWNENEIMVDHPIRKAEGIRDATVFTAGLTTNITGLHCNVAVLDDVVVKENAYTEDGRKKVENQYSLLSSIETSDAKEWIVGTRYHPKDLYGTLLTITEEIFDEDGELVDSEQVYEVFQKTVEDQGDGTGTFLWPRQQRGDGKWFGFNTQILARKRAKYLDKTQYYAQYYNNPNDPQNEAIESKYFQYFDPMHLKQHDGKWWYHGRPLNIFAAMDFAYSLSSDADYTALVVIGIDFEGNIYILDLERKRTKKIAVYFDMLYRAHMKWGFRKIAGEVTAAQEVIVERLQDDIRKEGLRLSIDHYRPTRTMGTKEERIANTLTPYYENYSVWHPQSGMAEILESELVMENPPNDDLKDALHSAVRIMRVPPQEHTRKKRSNIITHSRFGGVAYG
jgi:phage terminase large subunit-like protein